MLISIRYFTAGISLSYKKSMELDNEILSYIFIVYFIMSLYSYGNIEF